MKGVEKLSLEQALFRSQKSIHTWMVPCLLFMGMGLDTHSIKGTGWMKPTLSSFSTSTLIAGAFLGLIALRRCQTGLASG